MFPRRRKTRPPAESSDPADDPPRASTSTTLSDETEDVKGSLGLNILHAPLEPLVDLIFVHGLRGGSRKTWSKTKDDRHFWPKQWLPRDPDFKHVRIHSFGYQSNWANTSTSSINVHDLGKSLLGEVHNSPYIRSDNDTPIVLIGHSMGGILIKKTYILARQDPTFHALAKRFHSLYFLATPHRGSDSARLLGNILRTSVFHGQKPYVKNLEQTSEALQVINDEFRHYADGVQLRSFYETRETQTGVTSSLIVTKDSAVLGYPNEQSAFLNANHRDICKFDTDSDPNFVTLRNVLVSTIEDVAKDLYATKHEQYRQQMRHLQDYLGVEDRPEDDFLQFDDARSPGSCEWFANGAKFCSWRDGFSGTPKLDSPRVFWLNARPATGKSVLASYVIANLETLNLDCSYFFFKHDDKAKATSAALLRSLAYQMALLNPSVRKTLLALDEDGVRFNRDDERVIWRKIFLFGVLQSEFYRPQYWVIDALDECCEYGVLFTMLTKIEKLFPLRLFVTSRQSPDLDVHFSNFGQDLTSSQILPEDSSNDIMLYITLHLKQLAIDNDRLRQQVVKTVLEKARGCFLWVVLVMDELSGSYSEEMIDQVLDEVPYGMEPLYERTLETMSKLRRGKKLAKTILEWAMCCSRPMTLEELQDALKLDIGDTVVSLKKAISSSCGHLVYVDKANKVQVVHQTAREFLCREGLDSEFAINRADVQGRLAQVCVNHLQGLALKPQRMHHPKAAVVAHGSNQAQFTDYACTCFGDHLKRCHSDNSDLLVSLNRFLGTSVLSWIEVVAQSGNLSTLIQTSKSLKRFLEAHSKYHSPIGPESQRIRQWSVDLVRIVSKFGRHLSQSPSTIHTLIPPFCPPQSAISSLFTQQNRGITVRGLSLTSWDDRLCCLNYSSSQAISVACADTFFAVGLTNGQVFLYKNKTFEEVAIVQHGEAAKLLQFSDTNRLLASSGMRCISVWNVGTQSRIWHGRVQDEALALVFLQNDSKIFAITRYNLVALGTISEDGKIDIRLGESERQSKGKTHRRPLQAAALCVESYMSAIVHRGKPIAFCDLEQRTIYGYCEKSTKPAAGASRHGTPILAMVCNPDPALSLLAVAFWDGDLALFDSCDFTLITVAEAVSAQMLACSPDGRTLGAGSASGEILLYDFETLRLLYRFSITDHSLRALSFSSDGSQIFDTGGSQCNVWEPSALMRSDATETESMSDTVLPAAIEGQFPDLSDVVEITTLLCSPSGAHAICGKSDGSVNLYELEHGRESQLLFRHTTQAPISNLCMSWKASLLVSTDVSTRLTARPVRERKDKWEVGPAFLDIRLEDPVIQVLFDLEETRLLASTTGKTSVWDVSDWSLRSACRLPTANARWINCPTNPLHLILVDVNTTRVYNWDGLGEVYSFSTCSDPSANTDSETFVKSLTVCSEKHEIVVEFARRNKKSSASDCSLMPISHHPNPKEATYTSATPLETTVLEIDHVIGVCSSRFIFLRRDSWICSMDGNSLDGKSYDRHFFIPDDWITSSSGRMVFQSTSKDDLVYAKADEIAVIKRGLGRTEQVSVPRGKERRLTLR